MLFNSFEFLLCYLPLVVVVYYLLKKVEDQQWSRHWLLFSSLFFYGWWNPIYLPLILGSMVFNFFFARWVAKESYAVKTRKRLLAVGVIVNLGALGFFKYTGFLLDNLAAMGVSAPQQVDIVLPLAISFFTFQQLAYLVDAFRGKTKGYTFFNYSLFVTFFPQLIAGPIVHHHEMMPQFNEKGGADAVQQNMARGIYMFAMGLCKKVVIADAFAISANAGYGMVDALSMADSWITSLSYTFQLYFDFSGYTDMAIGAALLFNIKLPINFNSPYRAYDIQDFWRRWHITLSRFLRDYLYISMGGNRVKEWKVLRNLLLTFLIGGLWHGAGWTFVAWGALHGGALVLHRVWKKSGFSLPKWVAWIITFNFVNIAWVFFRAPSFQDAFTLLGNMFGGASATGVLEVFPDLFHFHVLAIGLLLLLLKNTNERLERFQLNWKHAAATIGLIAVGVLYMNSTNATEFLYFDF